MQSLGPRPVSAADVSARGRNFLQFRLRHAQKQHIRSSASVFGPVRELSTTVHTAMSCMRTRSRPRTPNGWRLSAGGLLCIGINTNVRPRWFSIAGFPGVAKCKADSTLHIRVTQGILKGRLRPGPGKVRSPVLQKMSPLPCGRQDAFLLSQLRRCSVLQVVVESCQIPLSLRVMGMSRVELLRRV